MINTRHLKYGERLDEATGKIVKDATEQAVIRRILELRDQGLTPGHIANDLNDDNVPTKRGGRWYFAAVQKILDRFDDEADEAAGVTHTAEPDEKDAFVSAFEDYICDDGSVISIPAGSGEELRRTGRIMFDEGPYADSVGGRIKPGKGTSMSLDALKDLQARRMAEERLTVVERAERFKFHNPEITPTFGDCLHPENITPFAMSDAAKAMERVQDWIDQVEGQPRIKRGLRNEVKAVFREIAAERQFRLHLLQRLAAAEASAKASTQKSEAQ